MAIIYDRDIWHETITSAAYPEPVKLGTVFNAADRKYVVGVLRTFWSPCEVVC